MRRVNDVVADELQWVFRPGALPDYGIDTQIEVVIDDDAVITGRRINLQLKGGGHYLAAALFEPG